MAEVKKYNKIDTRILFEDVVRDAFNLLSSMKARQITVLGDSNYLVRSTGNGLVLFPIKGDDTNYIHVAFGKGYSVNDATVEMTEDVCNGVPVLHFNVALNSLALTLR